MGGPKSLVVQAFQSGWKSEAQRKEGLSEGGPRASRAVGSEGPRACPAGVLTVHQLRGSAVSRVPGRAHAQGCWVIIYQTNELYGLTYETHFERFLFHFFLERGPQGRDREGEKGPISASNIPLPASPASCLTAPGPPPMQALLDVSPPPYFNVDLVSHHLINMFWKVFLFLII